ncbi:MAG: histidinol-phosphatase HisJ family protein [candidate division Zixibacteria bacterium]|nr:histidinol-phosphatase HisJ family protein [candidate division Zixibacteria bacterium]
MPDFSPIEPLATPGLTDYHCHCDYSIDAYGTIDEYCEAALQRGLAEICFTTHWDTNSVSSGQDNVIRIGGQSRPTVPDNLAPYVDDVLRARESSAPRGLSVVLGVEFGWYPGCEETAAALRDRYRFDHFLCGIHELEGCCFSCERCYPNCFPHYSAEQLVEKYVSEVETAAHSGLFDCIAHLDYIRKFGEAYYGPGLNDLLLKQLAERAFPALVAGNTAIEVNTSAIRRGFKDNFPRVAIVNAARRAGVEVRHLGSDAHAPNQVGFDFDAAASLVSPWSEAWCDD